MAKPQRIATCPWFNDNGEEAANFYVSLLPSMGRLWGKLMQMKKIDVAVLDARFAACEGG